MGFSYGVGIILGRKIPLEKLAPEVTRELDDLRALEFSFSVHHTAKLTLLAQANGDDARMWNEIDRIGQLAAKLAEHFGCQSWLFYGFGGSATEHHVAAFDAEGHRWDRSRAAAIKSLKAETKLKNPPFEPGLKPFLDIVAPWKQVGVIEVHAGSDFAPATQQQITEVFGRAVKIPDAQYSTAEHQGHPIQLLTFELTGKTALEKLGLKERGGHFTWPPQEVGRRSKPVALPDGSRRGPFGDDLDGLDSKRGKETTIRWATRFNATNAANSTWVQAGVARGPFGEALISLENAMAEASAQQAARDDENAAAEALKKRDVTKVLAVVKRGRVTARALLGDAAAQPKLFAALLKSIPASERQSALDGLLDRLPEEEVLALGATPRPVFDERARVGGMDLHDVDENGRTALHKAQDGALALAMVEAGAPLEVEDAWGETPVASFVEQLRYATPGENDVATVVAMVKRGGAPAIKTIQFKLRTWAKLKTHQNALKAVRAAIEEAR